MMENKKFNLLVAALVECLEDVDERAVEYFGPGNLCDDLGEQLLKDGIQLSLNDDVDHAEAEALVKRLMENREIKWYFQLFISRLLSHLEDAQERASL